MNNTVSATTGLTPSEVVKGFNSRDGTDILPNATTETQPDFEVKRKEAANSIAYAQAAMKLRYDEKHKIYTPREGHQVYLRLKNYNVPGVANRKLTAPRCEPFIVQRLVGKLAVKLNLPENWKIHPVVSIQEIELDVPNDEDPYHRPRRQPARIAVADSPAEVERILQYCIRRVGRSGKEVTEYLIRWKNLGSANDQWIRPENVPTELLRKYVKGQNTTRTARGRAANFAEGALTWPKSS